MHGGNILGDGSCVFARAKYPLSWIWMGLCCWLKTDSRDYTLWVVRYFHRMGRFGGEQIKNIHSFHIFRNS